MPPDMPAEINAMVAGAGRPPHPTDPDALQARPTEEVIDTRVNADSCANLATRAVDGLAGGGSFLLVADHDPRGIHYMLDAERPGSTTWQLLEDGPQRWQVRIGKVATAAPTG